MAASDRDAGRDIVNVALNRWYYHLRFLVTRTRELIFLESQSDRKNGIVAREAKVINRLPNGDKILDING